MTHLFPIAIIDMVAAAEREVRLRKRVYPGLIQSGRMSQDKANREIAMMEQIAMFLRDHDRATALPLAQ